jgi:hypothetical protein
MAARAAARVQVGLMLRPRVAAAARAAVRRAGLGPLGEPAGLLLDDEDERLPVTREDVLAVLDPAMARAIRRGLHTAITEARGRLDD